jgi:hypothetical protein
MAGVLGPTVQAQDLSSLDITANTASTATYVQLLIADPVGRQTGFQPTVAQKVQNIPGSSYFPESFDNEETGEAGTQIVRFGVTPATSGNYTITLIGLANHAYSMNLGGNDSNGNPANLVPNAISGYLSPGATQVFLLPFSSAAGAMNKVTKAVTFDVLRQELGAVFFLGEIGGEVFVDQLERILVVGQKALDRKERDIRAMHRDGDDDRNVDEAIEKLREFISSVEVAARKPNDVDHDHEKRFVTLTAVQSLTSDAKILIEQLGERSERDRGKRPGTER